ncbi:MAG: hypothetical protein JO021_00445 [Alphaproteobacteria bacterium]|nr:hypothetical protein [Alphaproteobacteria bacterium]
MKPIRFDVRRAPPPPHPAVRAARRATELAQIAAWQAAHGVTRCPPAFATASPQAAIDGSARDIAEPGPVATLADCGAWLARHGYIAFQRHPSFLDRFQLPEGPDGLRAVYTEAALIAQVRALQRAQETILEDACGHVLATLTACAVDQKPCPSYRRLYAQLRAHGTTLDRADAVSRVMALLVAGGEIAMRVTAKNVRVVTILAGPHAGASTAEPHPVPRVEAAA